MILDHLDAYRRYLPLHKDFAKAFEFLRRKGLAGLPAGRHEVDGERVFALVNRSEGRGRGGSPLEAHRRYIDIQYTVAGSDEIGWRPTGFCHTDANGYDAARDIQFFTDLPEVWAAVPAGAFAIFYPEDAHAPMAATGAIHKIIMKIAVELL